MTRKILTLLFLGFGIYYVFFFQTIDPSLKMVFKLLPMLLLIVLAFATKVQLKAPYYWLVSIGLIFCAIGDYTLQWFIVGLSFFLIGHIFYIFAFRSTNVAKTPLYVKVLLSIYGAIMLIWIAGSLFQKGDTVLAIAVIAYILVILTMGWTSFRTGSKYAIIGAVLFITSDSILATNRFMFDVPYAHELIMFTYYGAQFFLMLSIAQYFKIVQNPN
ncbi:lysoplasmalogenase [Lysinibacillus sp. 2017]|uniref:lysoplasmalogenase n=1 Tax=unclassified Lysinibacillus TaxID=2636778 RepID=UPI000D5281F6|nr:MULTISPECIES: lysoplasmalogenase [unclassified Lysinibacillus]AWE06116.1 lysoplasmalogenase [Lysinibacillus sp. 2017]TGN30750.1 lysoplasmalogenase [Lysinibacillus sp. S2017]